MNEGTCFTIIIVTIMIGFFGAASYSTKSNNEVKIACYEAMKVNPNLVCDSSVRITK